MKIFVSAGEVSGDLHGSHLLQQIKLNAPETELLGVGGNLMQAAGMKLLYHINQMSIVGMTEVIRHIPFLREVFRNLKEVLQQQKPDLLILIDYPGFNLRLAKIACELGIPVMYYIIPQIWAWGFHRIKKIAQLVERAAVIFPFEEALLRDAGIHAQFVGHPLLDNIRTQFSKSEFLFNSELKPNTKILGLLPGSRQAEIKSLLPEMIRTVKILKKQEPGLQVVIGQADNLPVSLFEPFLNGDATVKLVPGASYEIMKYSDALLCASGTVTLEAALFDTPMVIGYRTSNITFFLAKILVKIQNIGLPNIIAGKLVAPEFIQHRFKAEFIAPVLEKLLFDDAAAEAQRRELVTIRKKMGKPGAAQAAANMALEMISQNFEMAIPEKYL